MWKLSVAALVLTAGCSDVVVPSDLVLKCAGPEDCPANFTCRDQINVCVADADVEDDPPIAENVVVTPLLARAGQDVTVTFDASEALFEDPVVEIAVGDAKRFFTVTRDGLAITAVYRVAGDEDEGDSALRIGRLVDASGNAALGIGLGTVRLDFTPPTVVEVTSSPLAKDEGVIELRVRSDEALLGDGNTVTIADGRAFTADGPDPADALVSRFSLIADADVDAEGSRSVLVSVVDAAGNVSERRIDDAFVLDFNAPAITSEVRPVPLHFATGALANVSFTSDEVFAQPPEVELVAVVGGGVLLLDRIERVGLRYTAARIVGDGDPDGEYEVRLTGYADAAGNVGDVVVLDRLFLDGDAPVFLTAPSTSASQLSRAAGRSALTVDFALDEFAIVVARVGARTLTCNDPPRDTPAPIVWRCDFAVADDDVDSNADVTVTATDDAGNSRFATAAPVALDFTPPFLVSASVSPALGHPGDNVVVSLVANESLAADPALSSSPELAFDGAGGTFVHAVTIDDDEGAFTTSVELVDRAGNLATVPGPSFALDVSSPVIDAVVADRAVASTVADHDVVTLAIRLTEAIGLAGLSVTIGDRAFDSCALGVDPLDVTCTYQVLGDETEGVVGITVIGRDAAGNTDFAAASVTFDFTAPTLASATVSPALGHPGDNVVVAVVANEPLSEDPVLTVSGPGAMDFADAGGTFSHGVVAGDVEGGYATTVALVDLAGNRAPALPGPSFALDTSTPVVVVGSVIPAFASLVETNDEVRLRFTVSESTGTSAPGLIATIGDRAFDSCVTDGADTTILCTYAVVGGEISGAISIVVKDVAGNTGFGAATVTFDFLPPGLASATVSPSLAHPGDNVVVSVVAGEPLAVDPILTVSGPGTPAFSAAGGTFTHPVVSGDVEGPYTTTVRLEDRAGNVAEAVAGPGFFIDVSTPVVVSDVQVGPRFASVVPGNDVVALRFTVSEAVGIAAPGLIATIGGAPFDTCVEDGSPTEILCLYDVTGNEPQGEGGILIIVRDDAGNTGFAASSVVFDFDAPVLSSATVSPALARPGDNVVVSVAANEALGAAPVFTPAGPGPLAFARDGSSFSHPVVSGDVEGGYTSSVELVDFAGNRSTTAGPAFALDVSTPDVTALVVAPAAVSNVAGNDVVTVDLTLSEELDPLAPAVVVTVAGNPTLCSETGVLTIRCLYDVAGTEAEGQGAVAVELRDAAGNSGFASGGVVFDFTAPSVVANSVGISLTPAATNVLTSPTAVTTGTRVNVSFTLSEPTATRTVATTTPSVLAFVQRAQSGTTFVFDHTLATTTQGAHAVAVTARDPVGNEATSTLTLPAPGFVVDTLAPAAPAVGTPDAVVYQREPWGSDVSNGVKLFKAVAAANAVPGSSVIAYDGVTVGTTGIEIGRAIVGGTGAVVNLSGGDRAEIFVTTVDDAGNQSDESAGTAGVQATRVRDVSWTAGFGGKVVGSVLENPHEFDRHSWSNDDLTAVAAVGGAASDGLDQDDTTIVTSNALPTWVATGGLLSPGHRRQTQLAFDAGRSRVVLFGDSQKNDTWEFDGDTWIEAVPLDPEGDGKPATSESTALIYDAGRERVLLFGGPDNTGNTANQTWEWDGKSWNRRCNGSPSTDVCTSPPPRQNHRMAYDAKRGKVVLFGGSSIFNLSASRGDTWEWDGLNWTQRCDGVPATDVCATQPPARFGNAIAYDDRTGRTIMTGGVSVAGGTLFSDVWSWDGTTWTDVTQATRPPARQGATMGFLAARQELVLFGGATSDPRTGGGSFFNDTWSFDGTRWLQLAPVDPEADGNPQARSYFGGTPTAKGFEILGGNAASSCDGLGVSPARCNGIWRFDGASWSDLIPDRANDLNPSSRLEAGMAHDSLRRRTVLFGGRTSSAGTAGCLSEDASERCGFTWEWTGTHWTKILGITAATPAPRSGHTMAYDSVRDVVVMFGGTGASGCDGSANGDCTGTWEYNGTAWTKRAPATNPTGRTKQVMTFDEERGVIVMFGGKTTGNAACDGRAGCDVTWLWNGTNWTQATVFDDEGDGNPIPRSGGGMAFDDANNLVVLYGGSAQGHPDQNCEQSIICIGTWTWNGRSWRRASVTAPAQRRDVSLAFDRQRQRIQVIGGNDNGGRTIESIGEWDGSAWTNRVPVDPEGDAAPDPRNSPALAYDDFNGVTISFGGTVPDDVTWQFDASADRSASQQAAFSFRSSGAAANATVLRLDANFVVGGTGANGATIVNGADLLVWDGGLWRPVANNNAATTAPATLTFNSVDPLFLQRVFVGADRSLRFAVRPGDPNGQATALSSVSTDLAEINVRYRLP